MRRTPGRGPSAGLTRCHGRTARTVPARSAFGSTGTASCGLHQAYVLEREPQGPTGKLRQAGRSGALTRRHAQREVHVREVFQDASELSAVVALNPDLVSDFVLVHVSPP